MVSLLLGRFYIMLKVATRNTSHRKDLLGNSYTVKILFNHFPPEITTVKFVTGTVTGVRFYKGAGNTGTHTGHLWSATGTHCGDLLRGDRQVFRHARRVD